eukprot:3544091-Rhodomonas_salina.2
MTRIGPAGYATQGTKEELCANTFRDRQGGQAKVSFVMWPLLLRETYLVLHKVYPDPERLLRFGSRLELHEKKKPIYAAKRRLQPGRIKKKVCDRLCPHLCLQLIERDRCWCRDDGGGARRAEINAGAACGASKG